MKIHFLGFASLLAYLAPTLVSPNAAMANPIEAAVLTVNSADDTIAPDDRLTLREAISFANGDLAPEKLSPAEQQLITLPTSPSGQPPLVTIGFQLPPGQTIIKLQQALPEIKRSLTIDGTTQAGYAGDRAVLAQNANLRQPIVEITPANGVEVLRGLTITSDNVTIRGLSLYGFTSSHGETASTPPADIFIAHLSPPPDTRTQQPPASNAPFYDRDIPPKNILIENNWLGIRPDQSMPDRTSAFGVSVFNSTGTTIRNNWIANHDSSAIITGVKAENTLITQNVITGNGIAGMPDAIRLEGKVDRTDITGNHICGNDGSGIYLFKPDGSINIYENSIVYNGRRLRRAAVYLMGNRHHVTQNTIQHQTAAGVVVAAAPASVGNLIERNQFSDLEGLSIDLNTQHNTDVSDYQRGDGLNPDRNSPNRRRDTGNAAINAPQFDQRQIPMQGDAVVLSGTADEGSTVEIYQVKDKPTDAGALGTSLLTISEIKNGKFYATVKSGLKNGDRISAIAHHPQYGTSEPAINATIGQAIPDNLAPATPPVCVSPPEPPKPPVQPPPVQPPEPIRLKVPRNIHFALDKSFISDRSAQVLDKVAAVLKANPTIIIDLHGHTDPRASDAYNIELGKRRALSVRNYLLRKGIDPSRMTIRTFGERQRLSDGSRKLDYARDRRTEIIYKDIRDIEVIVQEDDLQIEP
ncbi:MAG: cell envelope biogenesis protein OmpA [Alkalinema sp. CACIAM 70d]|nr:MAG: cell envelope biogenesis protein OmpA [Alkalinema sp. CACIAM 70d]